MTRIPFRFALLLALPIALSVAPVAWSASRVEADLRCESFGKGPQLECLVKLGTAAGKPLTEARVTLSATMPAMPMAHHVKPAAATATGTPGEYRARLELEMAGAWSVQTDVAGPARDRIVRTLRIDPCDGDRRCPALPATAGSTTSAASHKH